MKIRCRSAAAHYPFLVHQIKMEWNEMEWNQMEWNKTKHLLAILAVPGVSEATSSKWASSVLELKKTIKWDTTILTILLQAA